jgi:hypothetical protein
MEKQKLRLAGIPKAPRFVCTKRPVALGGAARHASQLITDRTSQLGYGTAKAFIPTDNAQGGGRGANICSHGVKHHPIGVGADTRDELRKRAPRQQCPHSRGGKRESKLEGYGVDSKQADAHNGVEHGHVGDVLPAGLQQGRRHGTRLEETVDKFEGVLGRKEAIGHEAGAPGVGGAQLL